MSLLLSRRRRVGSVALPPSLVPDWEVLRDFNSGTLGTAANGTVDGFSTAAARTIYSNEQVFEGTQSGKIQRLNSDLMGFGEYGGVVSFPTVGLQGDTIWLDAMVFFPVETDLSILREYSKFFRIRTETAASGNSGYFDLYFASTGARGAYQFAALKENIFTWFPMGTWGMLTNGTWNRVTLQVGLGSVAVASGGTGFFRAWFNGSLLTYEPTCITLTNATDKAPSFYCATQYDYPTSTYEFAWYIDRIRIAKNGVPTWASALPGVS